MFVDTLTPGPDQVLGGAEAHAESTGGDDGIRGIYED
jgi:hypothetical protein